MEAFEVPTATAKLSEPAALLTPSHIIGKVGSDARKERAANIMNEIVKKREKISWKANSGTLVLNGKEIPGSYFPDIIDYVSNHKPSKNAPPGVTRFLAAMGRADIDPSLVSNAELRRLIPVPQKGFGYRVKWEKISE